ncbi:hypothetical protein KDA_25810 [Dictyobacter alpinus]|uniref:Uncharacterized protein n=1 Tax=Dictyobacter alpinus TaxID=2014873 RepID=A0A402B6Z5_9CHLR|nr:hypothetical protein [Dictyobacter alpinus]GCE27097.1 hypothetical protein KDA_25810 [Dictyobacter alpinus]
MPKSKQRKVTSKADNIQQPVPPATNYQRRLAARRNNSSSGLTGLVSGAIIALGCWGFAYTFTLQESPNRYLFAGMMALIALMWSISFGVRLRKWQQRRQN